MNNRFWQLCGFEKLALRLSSRQKWPRVEVNDSSKIWYGTHHND